MDCVEKVIAEFKGQLADSDMRKIFEDIEDMKKKNPWMTQNDLFQHVVEKRLDYINAKTRLLKQAEKLDEHYSYIQKAFEMDGVTEGNAKDIMYSFISRNGKFQRESLESAILSAGNEYRNTFELLERKGYLTLLRSKTDAPELHREIAQGIWNKAHGVSQAYSSTQVQEMVEIFDGLNKKRLADLQAVGFDVRQLNGYVFSGSYDPSIVRGAGRDAFIKDVLSKIDINKQAKAWAIKLDERGVPNEQFIQYVEEHFEKVSQSDIGYLPEHNSMQDVIKDLESPDRMNNVVARQRNLIFKDGANFYDFFNKYAGENLLEATERDLRRTARTIGTAQVFGTTPNLAIEFLFKKVNKELADAGKKPLDNAFKDGYRDLMKLANGTAGFSESVAGRTANVIKMGVNMAMLGKASVKAFLSDPVFAAAVQSTISRDNYYTSWARFMKENVKLAANPTLRKDMSTRMNLLTKQIIIDSLADRNLTGFEKGMIKAHDWYMKATGIPYQSLNARQANGNMAMMHMADVFDGKLDAAVTKADIAKLKSYGFSDTDMALMKAIGVSEVEGTRMLLPDNIRRADVSVLRQALGDPSRTVTELDSLGARTTKQVPYTDAEIKGMASLTSKRLGSLINDYALLGSPSPTAVTTYFMSGMRNPNTPVGALMSLVLQYKAFGASIYRVYRNNAWHTGVAETNKFKQYIFGGRGAMVNTLLLGTIMGAGANALSDILDGKTPRDPTAYDKENPLMNNFITESVMAGGVGGILTDYLLEDYEAGKKDFVSDIAGPIGRVAKDATEIRSEMMKAIAGQDNKLASKTLMKATRWLPAQNLWLSKAFTDKLFLDKFRDWVDPKYSRRKLKSMKEKSGKLYMQQPLF